MNWIARSPSALMWRWHWAEPEASGALNSQMPGAIGSVAPVPLHIGARLRPSGRIATSATIMRLFAYVRRADQFFRRHPYADTVTAPARDTS